MVLAFGMLLMLKIVRLENVMDIRFHIQNLTSLSLVEI